MEITGTISETPWRRRGNIRNLSWAGTHSGNHPEKYQPPQGVPLDQGQQGWGIFTLELIVAPRTLQLIVITQLDLFTSGGSGLLFLTPRKILTCYQGFGY